jgi:hypothetical protein
MGDRMLFIKAIDRYHDERESTSPPKLLDLFKI